MALLRTLLLATALVLLAAQGASAFVAPRAAALETGSFAEFDQASTANGTLTNVRTRAWRGQHSARARFAGGGNGYARGIHEVKWDDGEDVYYGAAYYLPRGFKRRVQGQVDLLRWDNWEAHPTGTDRGGIVIYGSDKRARLVRLREGVGQRALGRSFTLPEGRWFYLEVHQRLSAGAGARSEVFVNGRRVAVSNSPNSYGRGVDRVRYGIVAIDSARQSRPLTLYFDHARVSTRQLVKARKSRSRRAKASRSRTCARAGHRSKSAGKRSTRCRAKSRSSRRR